MRWIYVRKILHITVNSIFPPDSLFFFFFFSLKTPKNKNLKAILCGYNAKKYQLGSFISMLIVTSLLNPLFTLFFYLLFLFVYNVVLPLFSLLLIKILFLRPYESIKTSYLYYNHDDLQTKSKNFLFLNQK